MIRKCKSHKIAMELWHSKMSTIATGARLPCEMVAVLMCHPDWSNNSAAINARAKDPDGLGIKACVQKTDAQTIVVVSSLHACGSATISYVTAIKAARGSRIVSAESLTWVKHVARNTIRQDIAEWKRALGAMPGDDFDHFPISFDDLFRDFCSRQDISADSVRSLPVWRNESTQTWEFKSVQFAELWRAFHATHARGRLLPHAEHMIVSGQKRRRSSL